MIKKKNYKKNKRNLMKLENKSRIKVILLFILAFFTSNFINLLSAQKTAITTVVTGPYSNKITDYIYTGQVVTTYNNNGYCCWMNQSAGITITNTTTGATFKTKPANRISLNLNQINTIYVLSTSDLATLLSPFSLDVIGLNSAELSNFTNNSILPDGNYSFCFEYWASQSVNQLQNETDLNSNYCAFNINISAAAQLVSVLPSMSRPQIERRFNWFQNVSNLSLTITSSIRTYFNASIYISLSGDNGVSIRTKPVKCSTLNMFNVSPSAPYIATTADLQSWFNLVDMDITGLPITQFLVDGLLPNGNYTLCFIAHSQVANCTEEISNPALACVNFTIAADPIKFTVAASPLSSKKVADYSNNVLAVNMNTQSAYSLARVGIRIKGDNGVELQSGKGGRLGPAPTFTFNPNVPQQLSLSQIQWLFSPNNLIVRSGINSSQFLLDGELPDGRYDICFEAFNETDQIISDFSGSCLPSFTIGENSGGVTSINEAPILITPRCDDSVMVVFPQNLVFTWLPSSSMNTRGLSNPQEYILRIVEMQNFTDAWDAVRKATVPYFFEKRIVGTTYIYGPADPILEKGKKYAYFVQIYKERDLYRNSGRSEVCWFSWGAIGSDTNKILKIDKTPIKKNTPSNLQKIIIEKPVCGVSPMRPNNVFYIEWKSIAIKGAKAPTYLVEIRERESGNFQKNKIVFSKVTGENKLQVESGLLKLVDGKGYGFKVYAADDKNNLIAESEVCNFNYKFIAPKEKSNNGDVTVKGQIFYTCAGREGEFVYNGGSISIKEVYFIADKNNVSQKIYSFYVNPINNEPLQQWETKTDADGKFEHKILLGKFGKVDENFNFKNKYGNFSGALVHGIEIIINNPYYKPINKEFYLGSEGTLNIGKILTEVFTFNLKVKAYKGYKETSVESNCYDCIVSLYEQTKLHSLVPKFKRDGKILVLPAASKDKYRILDAAKTITLKEAGKEITQVEFKNLICTKNQAHHYFINAQYEDIGTGKEITAASEGSRTELYTFISKKMPQSVVKGQIFYAYKDNNTALPLSQLLYLKVCYVLEKNGKKYVLNKFNGELNNGGNGGSIDEIIGQFNQQFPDNEKTIGWTYSSTNGEFEIKAENVENYNTDLQKLDFSSGGGEFKATLNGNIYRCLRVVVANSYYTSPDEDIFIKPLETVNVGKLTAFVKAVDIKVVCKSMNLENQAITSGGAVYGLHVGLKRKGPMPSWFPTNEGDIYKQNNVPDKFKNGGYISFQETNANGEAWLKGVVVNGNKVFEELIILAESPKMKGDLNYFSAFAFNYDAVQLVQGYGLGKMVQAKNENFYPSSIYNSDNTTPTITVTLLMIPLQPVIKGRVMDFSKSENGLQGATVSLTRTEIGLGFKNEDMRTTKTDAQGYFELSNVNFGKKNPGAISDIRMLTIQKWGYHYKIENGQKKPYENDLGQLKDGEKRVLPEVYLKPNAILKGSIKDENGIAVEAYVAALGGELKESKSIYDKNFNAYSNYEIYVPPGSNVKIVVWPKDLKYFIDTITISSIKSGDNVFDIVAKKRLHRFKFSVFTVKSVKVGDFYKDKNVFLQGARIEIEGNSVKTDANGEAYMEFANTSTKNFYAKIWGPDGENYIQEYAAITNYESSSKSAATFTKIKLEKGRSIAGKITLNGQPFKGARIEESRPQTMPANYVRSDAEGNYNLGSLNTIGTTNVIIKVYVPSELQKESTIIGKEIKVDLAGVSTKIVNIELEEFEGQKINNFYGHKIEITNYKKINSETIAVDGFVILDDENSYFIPKENNKLAFSNLKYKIEPKGNGKYSMVSSMPADDVLITDKLMIYTTYGKNINVLFAAPEWVFGKPIRIAKTGTKAEMLGVATIVDNSFDFPGSYLNFGKSLFFFGEKEKSGLEKLIVVGAISSKPKNKAFNVCGWEGKPIQYKFLQFDAVSDPQESQIKMVNNEARLYMRTKIFAKFDNMTPSNLEIDLGTFEMNHEKIFPLTGKENLKFNLENWVVEVKNWQITTDKGGITSNTGFITAGAINIPFQYFHMQNNLLKFQDFELNNINLGNVVPLMIGKNTTPIFGFDVATGTDKKPHWKMTLVGNAQNPAASFGGIEGLSNNQKVNIEVLSLISNGEQLLSFGADAEPLLLYNVVKFKPSTITSYSDYFTMGGVLDVNIPRVSRDITAITKITKKGSGGKLEILPQQIEFEGKGFVEFKSLGTDKQKQKIEENKITWIGTVIEPGKTPEFKCVLTKEGYNGAAKIDLIPNQQVLFGKTQLIKVTGKKYVKGDDWDYLTFEGDLDGLNGINDAAKHLKFTVYGDIKAEGQEIKMDNIQTPFGGMELAFDLEKQRLTGHMDIDMQFSESLGVQGVANLVFDKGGFLISVAAQISAPAPINTFNAGILLGTYSNIPDQFLTDVVKYNYNKNIPCHLKNEGLTGFFITGARKLPLNIEPFSVDIPPGLALVSLYCGAESGLEMQLGMNFKGGLKLNANALVYAHAWGGINAITCTEASADATGELLINGWYENGKFAITGCGSVVLKVKGSQKVPILVGCTDPSIDLNTELGVKYIIEIGSNGFKNDVEFMLGKATGCTALLNCEGK